MDINLDFPTFPSDLSFRHPPSSIRMIYIQRGECKVGMLTLDRQIKKRVTYVSQVMSYGLPVLKQEVDQIKVSRNTSVHEKVPTLANHIS